MQETILNYGPPPLTQHAADAALEVIDFIATVVRGFHAVEVTNVLRPLWRNHLASVYSQLPFETRNWYVNAPVLLASINSQWPLLQPWQRGPILQQWAFELPQMLWMLEPVLAQAHQLELEESTRAHIASLREHASSAAPASGDAAAIDQLAAHSRMASNLATFNTQMTTNTINLMRAMSGR